MLKPMTGWTLLLVAGAAIWIITLGLVWLLCVAAARADGKAVAPDVFSGATDVRPVWAARR